MQLRCFKTCWSSNTWEQHIILFVHLRFHLMLWNTHKTGPCYHSHYSGIRSRINCRDEPSVSHDWLRCSLKQTCKSGWKAATTWITTRSFPELTKHFCALNSLRTFKCLFKWSQWQDASCCERAGQTKPLSKGWRLSSQHKQLVWPVCLYGFIPLTSPSQHSSKGSVFNSNMPIDVLNDIWFKEEI